MNKKRVRRKKVGRSFIRVFMSSGLFLFFFSNRKKDRARGPEIFNPTNLAKNLFHISFTANSLSFSNILLSTSNINDFITLLYL